MKDQFVTYEIALKLFKLDFNEKCLASYSYNTQLYDKGRFELKNTPEPFYFPEVNLLPRFILAPLWQQVIDWLREKHKIRVCNIINVHIEAIFIVYFGHDNHVIENDDFYQAREQAILKAIELCQKEK